MMIPLKKNEFPQQQDEDGLKRKMPLFRDKKGEKKTNIFNIVLSIQA